MAASPRLEIMQARDLECLRGRAARARHLAVVETVISICIAHVTRTFVGICSNARYVTFRPAAGALGEALALVALCFPALLIEPGFELGAALLECHAFGGGQNLQGSVGGG